jgi:phage-related protein
MTEVSFFRKPIIWMGSSLNDIKDARNFSEGAKREAGHQLDRVQSGLEPDDWRPFDTVGSGTKEIRINLDDGWFRVLYIAKFGEAVYVLHCFKKKSNKTSKSDIDIAKMRYKHVLQERRAK